jgi:FdhD protein
MRTPGDDYELAAGFLFGEGIIHQHSDIHQISYCVGPRKELQEYNLVSVHLNPGCNFDAKRLTRNFYTTSSCGVCGKSSIDALRVQVSARPTFTAPPIAPSILYALSGKLRERQRVFEKTGGLHAAGLFDPAGNLLSLREDVGRHNATDKLIGEQFLAGKTPLSNTILVLSGRASFELVQKALVAGIPVMAAVGAPSSLAVELAKEFGMTLLGFLRAAQRHRARPRCLQYDSRRFSPQPRSPFRAPGDSRFLYPGPPLGRRDPPAQSVHGCLSNR